MDQKSEIDSVDSVGIGFGAFLGEFALKIDAIMAGKKLGGVDESFCAHIILLDLGRTHLGETVLDFWTICGSNPHRGIRNHHMGLGNLHLFHKSHKKVHRNHPHTRLFRLDLIQSW
jgi:hypothetical protein